MKQQDNITSKDNPLIRHYRKLCENKRYRRTCGQFAAEGLRLVRDALQEQVCETVLLTQTAFAKYGAELAVLTDSAVHISDELGNSIAETEHTQGVFAVCGRPDTELTSGRIRADGHYLVLSGLQDPGNVGMILRTADAMGLDAVISAQSCEIYSPKVVRATMGAIFRIPVYEETEVGKIAELLKQQGIRSYAAVLDERAVSLTECPLGAGCAVWIGNEGNGLSPEAVHVCDGSVIIPMRGRTESLNAAMAAGILMWEMMKV